MISGVHISIFVMAVVQFIFIVPINFLLRGTVGVWAICYTH